jgi:hypothetical protein
MSSNATLTVLPIPPANDNFANRAPLALGNNVVGYTFGASKELGEPNHASLSGGRSIWWSWAAPSNGNYQVSALATNLNAPLVAAIYVGSSVSALTEIKSAIGSTLTTNGMTRSQVTARFPALGGTTYAIAIDHNTSASGFVMLSIAPLIAPMLGTVQFDPSSGFAFSFTGTPGGGYAIEASADLKTWFQIANGVIPPSGTVTFSAPSFSGSSWFYRVVLPP